MIEKMFAARGITVDHTTINQWVVAYAPKLEALHRKKKPAVTTSWRMDETYIKVKGRDCYLYRAVDKDGNTVDFLLTKKRDAKAAKAFFRKAFRQHGQPEKVCIDKSGSNKSALMSFNEKWVLLQTQTILSRISLPTPLSSFTDEFFWPPFLKGYNPSGCSLVR